MISLWTAATGMESMKFKIEVIANNLANTNTDGFKRTEVDFSDILYQYRKSPTIGDSPTGLSVGLGAKVAGTTIQHKQGSFKVTENQLDWAINGKGFFRLVDPQGNIAYSRSGAFKQDETGRLVNTFGWALDPTITITQDQTFSHISEDGTVWARQAGSTILQNLGRINISIFPNPAGLEAIGNSMYYETLASGAQQAAPPKTPGYGSIVGGALEASNVQIVHEMVDLISTQKAFDTNSKVVTVSDKMMDTANNLTR